MQATFGEECSMTTLEQLNQAYAKENSATWDRFNSCINWNRTKLRFMPRANSRRKYPSGRAWRACVRLMDLNLKALGPGYANKLLERKLSQE